MTSKLTREENVQAVFDLKAGYTLGLADVEILKRVARMALAAMDSEPVAEVLSNRPGNDTSTIDMALPVGTQLYRHAQQPVVPPMQHWEELCRQYPDMSIRDAIIRAAWWNHCRAAMFQDGTLTNEDTNNCLEIAETPTGFDNLTFDEHRKYIGLANIEIRRFQTIPDKKYIADLLTIAVNSLYESINTFGEVSSPAIPEGYVMVPKEATLDMLKAGAKQEMKGEAFQYVWQAMLAAATQDTPALNSVQSVVTVPGKWIPVSERMPDDDTLCIAIDDIGVVWTAHYDDGVMAPDIPGSLMPEFTHWMPLPAGPQEGSL